MNACQHCSHPHGRVCVSCEDAAQVGCLAPCATVIHCEHKPDARGVKCAHCGIPAEMVPPDELQDALWAEITRARLAAGGQLAIFDAAD